jgi:TPR repeat protein
MGGRYGTFMMVIGTAFGTLSFAPIHASAQDSAPISCAEAYGSEPLEALVRCAEGGDAVAQNNLGELHANGLGVPVDHAEGLRWFRLSAEQGFSEAQFNLGRMYGRGDGVPADLVYAYFWCDLAAAQGNEIAQSVKELIGQIMTSEQIAEAQRLSREWTEVHP